MPPLNIYTPSQALTAMICNSFIFLERVGRMTEQRLWNSGIHGWRDFLSTKHVPGFGTVRKGYCDRQLLKAEKNLLHRNAPYFANILPAREHWRLYESFKDEAVFLDIETTGYYGDITVVGLYDGIDTKIMVKGINLDLKTLKEELRRYKMLITFNGSSFDLPVLERYYPGVVPFVPHMDLRHVCARIGLSGGLKAVERRLGISRPAEVEEFLGSDAVYLWNAYKSTGDREYLDKLIAYNEEDIINLKPLADFAYKKLRSQMIQKA